MFSDSLSWILIDTRYTVNAVDERSLRGIPISDHKNPE